MPPPFTIALIVVILALISARLIVPSRWNRTPTRPFTVVDLGLVVVGTAGLLLHCGAMFYRDAISVIPGSGSYVYTINQLGLGSVILYVIPASVLLLGLRRQQPLAVTLLGLALIAVGLSMYNNVPLTVHLTAIFISAVILAATLALCVDRPRRARAKQSARA